MARSLALVAFLLLPAAAVAADPPTASRIWDKDGLRFEYVTRLEAGERIHITGHFNRFNEPFDLTVKPNGRVFGSVGDSAVEFRIGQRRRDNLFARLRARQDAATTSQVAASASLAQE